MEAQGQIQDFLSVLSRRRWQIALPAIFFLVLGVAFAVIVPKKHMVVTRIELRESRLGDESIIERESIPAKYHIRHNRRVREVIEEQSELWPEYFELEPMERNDFVRDVIEDVEIEVLPKQKDEGSTFVDIVYSDVDPERAVAFLQRLTRLWIDEVVERDLNAVRSERDQLQEELVEVRREHGELRAQYYDLAEEMGIDPTQPVEPTFQNSGDLVARRLAAAVEERDALKGELREMLGELGELEKQLLEEPERIEQPVDEEALVFETQILRLEDEIRVRRAHLERYTPRNSRYRVLEEEIAEREERIAELRAAREELSERSVLVANPVRPTLVAAIREKQSAITGKQAKLEELQERVADLRQDAQSRVTQYEELATLKQEMDVFWAEIAEKEQLLERKGHLLAIMQDAYGRPFDIAQEPEASAATAEPSPALIVALFLVLGLAAGLGFSMLAEYGPNAFRSVHDLRHVMNVPVLGVVNEIVTRAESRRLHARRTLVGLSSAIVLGSVLWVTWTWVSAPERLPPEVLEAIEGLRRMLS